MIVGYDRTACPDAYCEACGHGIDLRRAHVKTPICMVCALHLDRIANVELNRMVEQTRMRQLIARLSAQLEKGGGA